ncbi:cytochrome P450 84A1-like [Olea europaea var. sylvestris]|nr:cytochrome P450 84A1-like [Olea europaea var. sylvestris]
MEEKNIISYLAALETVPMFLLFIVPLLFLFLLSRFQHKPYPPGPKGWPLIGNMAMMEQLTHRGLANLAKQYGGMFHLRMGSQHIVVVSNSDISRQILQVQDNIFSNRPVTVAIRYLTYGRADMVFAQCGPFWRQMRKLCVMKLFSRKRVESWDSVRDEVDQMIRIVATKTGTAVNIGELVFEITTNIIYRAAFGGRSSHQMQDEFLKILQEFSKLFGAFNTVDFIPWLGWIDPQGINNRLFKARASLDGFIDSIIDDHIQKKDPTNGLNEAKRDMVDELLEFYSDENKVSVLRELDNSIKLKRNNIKAIIMDVMFGGTEAVASAVEWVMAELMRNPEELKKVQQELVNTVGLSRKVEESDLEKLTYLRCCIKEVLRLHPPIPLLLHQNAGAVVVADYLVPPKSLVLINVWAIGHDSNTWGDPDSFKPSRFMKDGVPDFKGNDFEFIPFGSGRRSCPGMQLALYEMDMVLAHLLHCFSWELPDGMKPSELDMDDVFGLTVPRATRLVALPSPRLSCPLF